MGIVRGWLRFPGHFILFAAPPCGVGYWLFKVDRALPLWVVGVCMSILAVVVLLMEVDSTKRGVQTLGKAVVDTAAKLGGALAGFLSHFWW
jgi:hypothetical protein